MEMQEPVKLRWRQAIKAAELGGRDLRPELETVHHSPQWKQRFELPEPHAQWTQIAHQGERVLGMVEDLLRASVAQLDAPGAP